MRHATLAAFVLFFGAGVTLAQDAPKPDPNKVYYDKLTTETAQASTHSEVCLGGLYAAGAGMGVQRDLSKAFQLYESAAAHGDLEGEREVSMAYMFGVGVQKDVEKAASIFRALSEKGYAPADLDISLMYSSGTGAPQDDIQALSWLEEGANAGDPDSQIRLAIQYHFGNLGLRKDEASAQKWLAKAVSQKIDCMPT